MLHKITDYIQFHYFDSLTLRVCFSLVTLFLSLLFIKQNGSQFRFSNFLKLNINYLNKFEKNLYYYSFIAYYLFYYYLFWMKWMVKISKLILTNINQFFKNYTADNLIFPKNSAKIVHK